MDRHNLTIILLGLPGILEAIGCGASFHDVNGLLGVALGDLTTRDLVCVTLIATGAVE